MMTGAKQTLNKYDRIRTYIERFRSEGHAPADVHAMDALISGDADYTVFYHLTSLRRALLNWYPFRKTGRALDAGAGCGALTGFLTEVFDRVDAVETDPVCAEILRERYAEIPGLRVFCRDLRGLSALPETDGHPDGTDRDGYDLILLNDVLDRGRDDAAAMIRTLAGLLAPDGTLLIGFRNREAVRYACGALDPFVTGPYRTERLFSPGELLDAAAPRFTEMRIYGAMPEVSFIQAVYTDDFLPEYSIRDRVFPFDAFDSPLTEDERSLYDGLVRDRTLPERANYILLECRGLRTAGNGMPGSGGSAPAAPVFSGPDRKVIHAALSTDRGPAESFATILYSDGTAEKKALYPAGIPTLRRAFEHLEELKRQGIPTAEGIWEESERPGGARCASVRMPLIREQQLMDHLAELVRLRDRSAFTAVFTALRKNALRASGPALREDGSPAPAAFAPEVFAGRPVLSRGFPDMIPYNAFRSGNGLRYYDQEFLLENCPLDYILFRAIRYTYIHIPEAEQLLPIEELKAFFGLTPAGWAACMDRENAFVNANRHTQLYPQVYRWSVYA